MDTPAHVVSLLRGDLHRLSVKGFVVLSQLPLFTVMVGLYLYVWVVHPELARDPRTTAAMLLGLVLTVGCLVLPWNALPPAASLVVPVLDFVPVGLLRDGLRPTVGGVVLLAVFPVVWLAASGRRPRLSMLTANLARQDAELRRLLAESARRQRVLRTILETVDVGVLVIDEQGREVLANQRQRRFEELATPEGAGPVDRYALEVFGADGTRLLRAEERPARRALRGEEFSNCLIRAGSPRQRVFSASARALRDEQGRPG